MVVPLGNMHRIAVVDNNDGTVSLILRRAYGFAIELVLSDSPVTLDHFLTAWEMGFSALPTIKRMNEAANASSTPTPPPSTAPKTASQKFGTVQGYERRKRGGSIK